MLIDTDTWQDLREIYGNVKIEDMRQEHKDQIFNEACRSCSPELEKIMAELVADNWLSYMTWQAHRPAMLKMRERLWNCIEAEAQIEADEWEALSDDTQN